MSSSVEQYAAVAVSNVTYWVDRPYTYHIPEELRESVVPGMRVIVPFSRGNRRAEGIVLSLSDTCDFDEIKDVWETLDSEPMLTPQQLRMALWMRERFFCTAYEAVRAILPAGLWFQATGKRRVNDKIEKTAELCIDPSDAVSIAERKQRRAPLQAAVLRLLAAVGVASLPDIHAITGADGTVIKSLEKSGHVSVSVREVFRRPQYGKGEHAQLPQLTPEQSLVFGRYRSELEAGSTTVGLLQGVTGSGKTSVYAHLIDYTLRHGKSVILLVPEISLTPQMLETFSSWFGDRIAVLHSSLSVGERYDEWKRVKSGAADLVIGTRSAIFAPTSRLGLTIIDEEQDTAYKSENSPRYHAVDIAKYRCLHENSVLLLGSATPNIDTRYRAEQGTFIYTRLDNRYNAKALPQVRIVDMKDELRQGNRTCISGFLREELSQNIQNGTQSILFLNRRGASKLITCSECGYIYNCPHCSVSLTYHSFNRRMICHYCGYSVPEPRVCPACGGALNYVGDGTQKIETDLHELFPNTEILRVDSDTVSAAGSHEALLSRFTDERIPIMIGTQMVTKGLNFSNVTLVGVISADQSLYSGGYRAAERTFSLITQVIGRSGRGELPGRAVIQTFTPENEIITLAARQDYDSFYTREIAMRRAAGSPPFRELYTVSGVGMDEQVLLRGMYRIRDLLVREFMPTATAEVLGPAPYFVVRVNRQFRYRITVAATPGNPVRPVISRLLRYCNTDPDFKKISVFADYAPEE